MSYIFAFFLLLIPLVVFHELGHFLVAKLFRIRISQFAFGFGQKLFGVTFGETEYRWNLIPLGGYVDFMGDAAFSEQVPDDPRHFLNQEKWKRFLVLLAGPMFNFILAIAVLWGMAKVAERVSVPYGDGNVVGYVEPESVEAEAGLRVGDRLLAIDGKPFAEGGGAEDLLFKPGQQATITVMRNDERIQLEFIVGTDKVEGVGVVSFDRAYQVVANKVTADSPAERAGIQDGDIITHIEGQRVFIAGAENQVKTVVNASTKSPLELRGLHDGQQTTWSVVPEITENGDRLLGIFLGPESRAVNRSAAEALAVAWDQTLVNSTLIFRALGSLVRGHISVKSMAGPATIGKVAKQQLDLGFFNFVYLMALLSINLGVVNLIPIPILDGGEMFVIAVEWVARRNFALMTKNKIKYVGFFLLVGIMGMVLVTDTIKIMMAQ